MKHVAKRGHTSTGGTAETNSTAPVTTTATASPIEPGSRQPMVDPVELNNATVDCLFAALGHVTDLNRHRTELVRAAGYAPAAATLFLVLTAAAARVGGPLASGTEPAPCCTADWAAAYVERGLIESDEVWALELVLSRVARHMVGFPDQANADEHMMLFYEPQSLVRAAYAVSRDSDVDLIDDDESLSAH